MQFIKFSNKISYFRQKLYSILYYFLTPKSNLQKSTVTFKNNELILWIFIRNNVRKIV